MECADDREMQHRDLLDIDRGRLAEQFVAQELLVAQDRELFYWAREVRGSSAEVDYLVARDGRIHPVEVKSGTGGQLRSLHRVLADYPGCGDGWVLSGGPFGQRPEQRIEFIPRPPPPGRPNSVANTISVGSRDDITDYAADTVENTAGHGVEPHHRQALGDRVDAVDTNRARVVEPTIVQIRRVDAK